MEKNWQLLVGLGLPIISLCLPAMGVNIPLTVAWAGFFVGFLFLIWAGLLYFDKFPKISNYMALFFIVITAIGGSGIVWVVDGVLSKRALKCSIDANIVDYPPNTIMGTIKWNEAYTDIHVTLENTTDRDFTNLSFIVKTDMKIAEIGQITNLPNVSFEIGLPPGEIGLQIIGKDGKPEMLIPLLRNRRFRHYSNGYHVKCLLLPRHRQVNITIAAVTLTKPNIKKTHKRYEKKRMPKWVLVWGNYKKSGREYTFMNRKNFKNQLD